MRRFRTQVLAALVLAVVLVAGCSTLQNTFGPGVSTERGKLRAAADMYATVANSLADAIRADKLDADEVQQVTRWRGKAKAALDEWERQLKEGGPTESAQESVMRAVGILNGILIDVQGLDTGGSDGN